LLSLYFWVLRKGTTELAVSELRRFDFLVHLLCHVVSSCENGFDIHAAVVAHEPCKAYG
jgi:hypothetical protein